MTRLLTLVLLLCPTILLADEPEEDLAWGIEIFAEVPRPRVDYILTRQKVEDLEAARLREQFLPKIVRSVERKPF